MFVCDVCVRVHPPGYIKTKSYSIGNMEERERAIREGAEKVVAGTLSMPRDWFFRWVLFHARRGVKHRENLRFARTKLYGVFRDVIRAMGGNLVQLGLLEDRQVSGQDWVGQRGGEVGTHAHAQAKARTEGGENPGKFPHGSALWLYSVAD